MRNVNRPDIIESDVVKPNVIELRNIFKRYSSKDSFVLDDVSLHVKNSEVVALLGPSGSGKSTLLHIAGLIDSPTEGSIFFEDEKTENLADDKKTSLRLRKIGFVYQYHHLLQEFSALENVMLPMLIAGKRRENAKEKAKHLLEMLKLKDKIAMFPSELSGGQKQRVAIARAMVNDPVLLLADEPTGNLDPETAQSVFDDMLQIMKANQMSAIVATHNYDLAKKMHRQCSIEDGKLIER
ncbi:MAG: ABC transporter ATP-binding protein [Alphaproteobacteria bacterium]|nr:ABC transporter ATP-binding protein [Alphaproteobacteria bacterium]